MIQLTSIRQLCKLLPFFLCFPALVDAQETLQSFDEQAIVEQNLKMLKDELSNVRQLAAEYFFNNPNHKAVEALIKLLPDRDFRVASSAAKALGKIGDQRAQEPLIKAMKGEFNQERPINFRREPPKTIEKREKLLPSLEEMLKAAKQDGFLIIPYMAYASLSSKIYYAQAPFMRIKDRNEIVLKMENSQRRTVAAVALGNFRNEKVQTELVDAIKRNDQEVLKGALYGLAHFDEKKIIKIIKIKFNKDQEFLEDVLKEYQRQREWYRYNRNKPKSGTATIKAEPVTKIKYTPEECDWYKEMLSKDRGHGLGEISYELLCPEKADTR